MPKLDTSGISDKEAFLHLANRISKLTLEQREKLVVVMGKNGKTLIYKLGEALAHAEKALKGERDEIGELELKLAKEELAYEKRFGRKT